MVHYLERYRDAYDLMRDGRPGAEAAFEALLRQYPEDRLIAIHLARLRAGASGEEILLDKK